MASGTPILVYGPPISSNVRYAIREDWGFVVKKPGKTRLVDAIIIIKLMKDHKLRVRLGRCARALAFRNHDATDVRQIFRKLMCDVAFG